MERIEADKGGIWVSGHPWQKGVEKRIGIGSLVSNVLCGRHNNRLSDLDRAAVSLVKLVERKNAKEPGFILETVDGLGLERFFLKMLCGILASGSGRTADGDSLPPRIQRQWLELLFGRRRFAYRTGLFIPSRVGDTWDDNPNAYAAAPLLLKTAACWGFPQRSGTADLFLLSWSLVPTSKAR